METRAGFPVRNEGRKIGRYWVGRKEERLYNYIVKIGEVLKENGYYTCTVGFIYHVYSHNFFESRERASSLSFRSRIQSLEYSIPMIGEVGPRGTVLGRLGHMRFVWKPSGAIGRRRNWSVA